MPNKNGTGPDGTGPKKTNQGTPIPRRVGGGGGKRSGQGRGGSGKGRGRNIVVNPPKKQRGPGRNR